MVGVYVVVQFFPWFQFYFPLFSGMVMFDNEFERKIKFEPRIKLNYNIYIPYLHATEETPVVIVY